MHRVNTEADVIWVDGHSDYGHAFETFYQRHYHEITPKTSIILLGDARNNYHASRGLGGRRAAQARPSRVLARPGAARLLGHRRLDLSEYGKYCDGVFECRNLRQLQQFVTTVAEG